jgi:alpha-N-acetylglucosamine transferase
LRNHQTIKTTAGRDVVVLVTPSISEELRITLRRDGAIVKEVDKILPKAMKDQDHVKYGQWGDCFTKFHLWNLIQYDRIMYLDSDVLPIKNLDDAFKLTYASDFEFLAPADRYRDLTDLPTFNAGIMLLRPSSALLRIFLRKMESIHDYQTDFMEQGFLNWYYTKQRQRLPREYSGNFVSKDFSLIQREKLRTVHEKYWWLSKDKENEAQVRELYEDGIAKELRFHLPDSMRRIMIEEENNKKD